MSTFANLVDDTLAMFTSVTGIVEQACELVGEVVDNDSTLILSDRSMAGRGLYEVDDELVYAVFGDPASGSLTIPAYGRGMNGSTAAGHLPGARVTRNPRVPRARAKTLLNQAILGLYPDLFTVKRDESQNVKLTQWGYEVPADVEEVLDVQYRMPPFGDWIGVREWRLDSMADPTDFPSGKSIAIGRSMWTGSALKVTYMARPTQLVNNSDDWTLTGLPASSSDLAVLWAAERLVSGAELLRTQTGSVEQSQRSLISPAGAAANASRLMRQQFTERLAVERRALMSRYGLPRIVRSWT